MSLQAIFNLDLDYSDDDALLDWEQYAGGPRGASIPSSGEHSRRCVLLSVVCLVALRGETHASCLSPPVGLQA